MSTSASASTPQVLVFDDATALTHAAAERVVQAAESARAARGRFLWCLSGGRTPSTLYALLATDAYRTRIDWTKTHVCFGDERCVAPDDPSSNYGMAKQALLQHVPVPGAQVLRVAGELAPQIAADTYQKTLQALLGVSSQGEPVNGFDLLLLGMGDDGHTASLFPGSVDEPERWTSVRSASSMTRITLTPRVLNASRAIDFLVTGADKAARLAEVLYGPRDPQRLPAQRISPYIERSTSWLADRAAAAHLPAAKTPLT